VDQLWECSECQRAYTAPGHAEWCHPDKELIRVGLTLEEIRSDLKRKREEQEEDILFSYDFEPASPQDTAVGPELAETHTKWGGKLKTHKSGAKRANEDKVRYDLVPIAALRDAAQAWTFGAEKYGDRNWEKGFDWSGPYGSMQRHLQAWFAGEDFDKESGLSHLAHAACNLQMLQQFEYTYPEGDNRPAGSCPAIRRSKPAINPDLKKLKHDLEELTAKPKW
jgi:hypothetical protein